ncbi:alpha/beta fold hydrolase [Dysgonomonas sp. 25]|uniref:alpha/beta hydrolase n=1 Tax=Dysgonomonas sp. 25 TaxID=2302933 RepID=UPI0013D8AE8A
MLFILCNAIIALQCYSISHFNTEMQAVITPTALDTINSNRIKALFLGIDVPKPKTARQTKTDEVWQIPVGEKDYLEAWLVKTTTGRKGIVALFHGFMNEKSMMLREAFAYKRMGYDVLLVDFIGSGGSSGNQCTIGYYEAENVKSVYDYLKNRNADDNIFLGGFSMGAVAIIKAQHDYEMDVSGIIIEAPFGRLEETIAARADIVGIPATPASQFVTFWFGAVNGFNAFAFNPEEDIQTITVPTLLLFGGKDQYISPEEAQRIYDNSGSSTKQIHIFPHARHHTYMNSYRKEWTKITSDFLTEHSH